MFLALAMFSFDDVCEGNWKRPKIPHHYFRLVRMCASITLLQASSWGKAQDFDLPENSRSLPRLSQKPVSCAMEQERKARLRAEKQDGLRWQRWEESGNRESQARDCLMFETSAKLN